MLFNSKPHCDDKVLPSVSCYDKSNESESQPICTINMNTMNAAESFKSTCNNLVSILDSDEGKV